MQTKGRTLQPSGKHSIKRVASNRRFTGDRRSEKDASPGGKPVNNFLNAIFFPIPATRLNLLFDRNSYDFLYHWKS
jgi:hypothetical protein